jgi:hypothetical protein
MALKPFAFILGCQVAVHHRITSGTAWTFEALDFGLSGCSVVLTVPCPEVDSIGRLVAWTFAALDVLLPGRFLALLA